MLSRSAAALTAFAAASASDDLGFKMHFYAPEGEGPHPVLFFVTGFSGLAPTFLYSDFVEQLVAKGYIVLGLDHLKTPNYPEQGGQFHEIMEWAREGKLQQALLDKGFDAVADLERAAVMGQSAGNHVVGQGLKDGCSLAKAFVMIDPVDGFDPFGIIKKQDLIVPGQKLPFSLPSLLLDNELDGEGKPSFPACAPLKLGAPRWFDATAGPVWNVNASSYGHVDCLNDAWIGAGKLICPSDAELDKSLYRKHLADAVAIFLEAVLDGKPEQFDELEDASKFGVSVTLRQDLKGLPHSAIKAGCSNGAVLV